MKNYSTYLFVCLLLFTTIISCNSRKTPQSEKIVEQEINDSMKLNLNVSEIDSMVIILDNSETKLISHSDSEMLINAVRKCDYDTIMNRGDMMIKMQAPDYTVVVYNKGKQSDASDWLMIWKENGRAKFKNKWYFLADDTKTEVYQLLGNYVGNIQREIVY